MPGACVFCQIAAGKLPARKVMETDRCVAFLDNRPLFPGHVLLIPREHYDTLPDLPAADVASLFQASQALTRAVQTALDADGTFVAINNRVSQTVPHLHVHVIPRRFKDGLKGFFWPRTPYRDEAHSEEVQHAIQAALKPLGY